jgi:spermidine synthase
MLLGMLFVDTRRMTILGFGGGSLAHSLSNYFPESVIQVVEIRPAVIEIAYDWFEFSQLDNLHVVNADANIYRTLNKLQPILSLAIYMSPKVCRHAKRNRRLLMPVLLH